MKKLLVSLLFTSIFIESKAQQQLARPRSKGEVLNEKYCSALFSTSHGEYFDLLDERNNSATSYLNILDWLQGRVAGLQVYTTKYQTRIPVIRNQQAAVYVNEMRVDFDYLNVLPIADIAMIKIIKGPSILPFSGGGVIAVYTTTGEEVE